jgi:glycerol-3-phosphate dehydrogenase
MLSSGVLRRDLARLAGPPHDVVIVGGGIHGAAAAWEAASRGLHVALVEAADFGGGASWNSLKTIHGGLRHLQRLDVAAMRESARERRALLNIAPGLVRPLGFLALAGRGLTRGRAALALGMLAGDLVTRDVERGLPPGRRLPPSRTLGAAEVGARIPGRRGAPAAGALWWDAQVESGDRLVLAFLHAAADAGAVVANRVEARGVLRDGEVVSGVSARDVVTGASLDVPARFVLNAAGPAIDVLMRAAGVRPLKLTPLRAVNLVLRRAITGEVAVGDRSRGRYLFAVPWRGRTIVGTAYAPASTPGRQLALDFLDDARRAFPWAGLEREDVALVHDGIVPGTGEHPATRSRLVDHDVEDGLPGLLTVVAAKFTTARRLAEEAVDLMQERLGLPPVPSRTSVTPLAEAHLLDGPLRERARAAVQREMALSLGDVVLRRLDLGSAGEPPAAEVDTIAPILAHEFGWDMARLAAERSALAAFFAERRLE